MAKLLEGQLFVKKSTIPDAGKGLFTKKFIPKRTRIVEYKGKVSKWKDVKDEDGKNAYIFYVNRNHVINGQYTMKALARYANDSRGIVKIKGVSNNSEFITDGLKAIIESKKDIPAGGEIFVDYGADYWKVIRENRRLWKQEANEAEKLKLKKKKSKTASKKKSKSTGKKKTTVKKKTTRGATKKAKR